MPIRRLAGTTPYAGPAAPIPSTPEASAAAAAADLTPIPTAERNPFDIPPTGSMIQRAQLDRIYRHASPAGGSVTPISNRELKPRGVAAAAAAICNMRGDVEIASLIIEQFVVLYGAMEEYLKDMTSLEEHEKEDVTILLNVLPSVIDEINAIYPDPLTTPFPNARQMCEDLRRHAIQLKICQE